MTKLNLKTSGILSILFLTLLATASASAQNSSPVTESEESTTTGTVISSTSLTLVVRSEAGQRQMFVFDRDTVRPRALTAGSTVKVVSSTGDQPGARLASQITVLAPAAAGTPLASVQADSPISPEIRRMERDIERNARKYRLGVRAGVALDPELIVLGVQAQFGPFFSPNVFFRPNVEFGIGEVTALFSLNPEFIYQLPASTRRGNWSPYVGMGPGFSFLHQNFKRNSNSSSVGSRVDFGEFRSSTAFNILGGVRSRTGMFVEFKTSVYSGPAPVFRMMVGHNF